MAERPAGTSRITGSTTVAAVIGTPVAHSRSPRLMNAAFEALGVDWVFTAFDVPEGRAAQAIDAARVLGLGGLLVTMPHKEGVIGALDRLTPAAEALGAVNSIAWEGEALVGDNTDGPGLVRSLEVDDGISVAERRCAVLGAGGAARSVIWALAEAGAAEVAVINRTRSRAEVAAGLAGPRGRIGDERDLAGADLIVNATSVGMGAAAGDDGSLPLDPEVLTAEHTVVDLVYQPVRTPLLSAAAARGARTIDGIGMLVHQAALSVSRFTGAEAPLRVMMEAARDR